MKLLKLQYYNTDSPVYLNPEYIVALVPKDSRYGNGVIGSVITLSSTGKGDSDNTIIVKETPDQIESMLHWEEITDDS